MNAIIELKGISRTYTNGGQALTVLKDIDLTIAAGELVAIIGASGSGKSTLMNIMGCLDVPDRGDYYISGQNAAHLSPDELARLRREHIGFIFQRYHLMPDLSALGNVEIPAIYANARRDQRRQRAAQLLARLGLEGREDHKPGQLSGGQQQRVSIARSLINGGEIIPQTSRPARWTPNPARSAGDPQRAQSARPHRGDRHPRYERGTTCAARHRAAGRRDHR